jgi:hypothetical protein
VEMSFSRRIFLFAAAAILVYQLMIPPVAGLADNGDFTKVTGRFDLFAPVHRIYEYIDTTYQIRPDKHWVSDFISTEFLLVPPALWLNSLVSKTPGLFDLRLIGAVHGALFLLALWLFAPLLSDKARWLRWTVYAVVLVVFGDAAYVCGLNSFYMDEAAFLFLLLTVVFYLRMVRWNRKRDAVLLIVSAFLLAGTKSQHTILGFWIALLFLGAAGTFQALRRRWWYLAAAGLATVGTLMIWKAQPADYASDAIYNVVFEKIVPHSKDPDRTMRELNLDESYRRCIGLKAYLPHSGMEDRAFRADFMRRISLGKLALFYLKRPNIAWRTMTDALAEAGKQHLFGSFALSNGGPPFARSHAFALWSDAKAALFFKQGKRFFFAYLTLLWLMIALLFLHRRELPKRVWLAGLCLAGGATMELGVSTLCDSMDIERHATIFLVLFDLILLTFIWLALDYSRKHGLSLGKLFRKLPHHAVHGEVETVGAGVGKRRPAEAAFTSNQ